MISTDDLRFFAVVCASSSLSGAARSLNISAPAVSQRLHQLEARLGVQLIVRSTRGLTMTDEGELLATRGQQMLADMDLLLEDVSARRTTVTGRLRVVAPLGFGRSYVAPVVLALREQHPQVTVDLVLSDSPMKLRDTDGWDMLLHVGDLRDCDLVVKRLAPNDRILCAAPSYLANTQARPLLQPEDLRLHDCAALRQNDEDVTMWRFTHAGGEHVSVRINPALTSNDGHVVRSWAVAGAGIIVRSEWDVADDLAGGQLVRVLPDWRLPAADVVALLSARRGRAARTVRFLELLQAAFDPPPWRIQPARAARRATG